MKSSASLLAFGTSFCSGVGSNWGKRNPILLASFIPSGHVCSVGVPFTAQILYISSCSLLPGKSGRRLNNSAAMTPMAKISIGELYSGERSNTSGARYHRVET